MSAADREKVTEKVQAALPDVSPDQINDLINQAEEYFLAKTGRRTIPDRATYLWKDIAVMVGKTGQAATTSTANSGPKIVKSVKRGDTTIEYDNGSSDSGNSSGAGLSGLDARIAFFKVAKIR